MKLGEIKNLQEMTLAAGNMDQQLRAIFDNLCKTTTDDQVKHIGDISEVKVLRGLLNGNTVDFFVKNNVKVGYMLGQIKTMPNIGNVLEIIQWYIIPGEQRQDLGFKYLYFLKKCITSKNPFRKCSFTSYSNFFAKTISPKTV